MLNQTPIVGESYKILCIRYDDGSPWLPVRGDIHSDEAEFFSSDLPHYHVDWRFAGGVVFRYFELKLNFDDLNDAPLIVLPATPEHPHKLKDFKKQCIRQDFPYPTTMRQRAWNFPYGSARRIQFRTELYKIYKGQPLNNGRCPHRGYLMNDVESDCKGRTVCPLHGITFGKSGKVIRPIYRR